MLSNLVLDELDRELERRGLAFVHYADDCNIYVRSRKTAERVMASVTRFIERQTHGQGGEERRRPAVEPAFLAFTLKEADGFARVIAAKTIAPFKDLLRGLTIAASR